MDSTRRNWNVTGKIERMQRKRRGMRRTEERKEKNNESRYNTTERTE